MLEYNIIPYHIIPYHTMPYHTIPYHTWMSSNRLLLNPQKSQYIWFGTRQQLDKLDLAPCPWNSLLLSSLPLSGTWGSSLTRSYLLLSISPRWLALASSTYASCGWSPALFPLLLLPP